jgi:predicted phosphodiesterase
VARLGWLTDIHLNFLRPGQRKQFYRSLADACLDGLLISGDIGEADSVERYLAEMEAQLQRPIYFVLGNHDFYFGSIRAVKERIARQAAASRYLRWLPAVGVVKLSATVGLVGHDGWADGRLGEGPLSEVLLTDYFAIEELRDLGKPELFRRLNTLGDEAAACLRRMLVEAFESFSNVILLTHVPPFAEACWHQGRMSTPDYLPHFASQTAGEVLLEVMDRRVSSCLTVLCGHSHSPGVTRPRAKLVVRTGGAEYGEPVLQGIIEV